MSHLSVTDPSYWTAPSSSYGIVNINLKRQHRIEAFGSTIVISEEDGTIDITAPSGSLTISALGEITYK